MNNVNEKFQNAIKLADELAKALQELNNAACEEESPAGMLLSNIVLDEISSATKIRQKLEWTENAFNYEPES